MEDIMTRAELKKYLTELGKQLKKLKVNGELVLCGGAVMVMIHGSRQSTNDVDGLFEPKTEIKECIRRAYKHNLDDRWLNDNFKHSESYIKDLRQKSKFYKKFGNLSIYTADLDQMIAMKIVAFRPKPKSDIEDLANLISIYRSNVGDINKQTIKRFVAKYYGKDKKLSVRASRYLEEL